MVPGLLLGLIGGLYSGCFDGKAAAGLPCETDADCGVDLSCDANTGCCGGPCTGSPGSSSGGPTSGPATQTGTDTIDDTTGSAVTTVSSSTGETDTVGMVCGDGSRDDPEECDEGGENTPDCDADCTTPQCGDEHVNPMAQEQCDDGPVRDFEQIDLACVDCLEPLFVDTMTSDTVGNWRRAALGPPPNDVLGINPAFGWHHVSDQGWGSGEYRGCEEVVAEPDPPCAGVSVVLDVDGCIPIPPALEDLAVGFELLVDQAADFQDKIDSSWGDGAVVELVLYESCTPQDGEQLGTATVDDVAEIRPIVPESGYPSTLDCDCYQDGGIGDLMQVCQEAACDCAEQNCASSLCGQLGEPPNPLAGRGAITNQSGTVRFPISPAMLEIPGGGPAAGVGFRFRAGYDCRRSEEQTDAWMLRGVAFRARRGSGGG